MPNDRPTPIFDFLGELLANNLTQGAAALGCSRPTLYACTVAHEGGRWLVRLPGPAGSRIGRRGRPTLLPGEDRPRPSVAAAARAAGVSRWALHNRSTVEAETRVVRAPITKEAA